MLQLPNNCRAGRFTVSPANWKSQSAKVNTIWKIQYWFYDDNLKKRKLVSMKGMNRLTTLKEKQDYVNDTINYETDLIKVRGWNHITESFSVVMESELSGATPVAQALEHAFKKVQAEPNTLTGIEGVLKRVIKATRALHFDRLPISDIRRRHLKIILDKVGESTTRWTNNNFNHFRKYLSIIFSELLEMEAIDTNPIRDLKKKKVIRKVRTELTKRERKILRENLPVTSPRFWIFLNIFYHSSSRETEMMRLRHEDVDLANERFKVTVKKGKNPFEEWRPIKDIAMPYWAQAVEGAKETDHIFSKGLKPGPKKIRADQITKRYLRLKKKYGIKADVYSFKHSNLDEMAAAIAKHKDAMQKVSKAAGHKGTVITMDYTQGELSRRNETVKTVWNEL